MTIRELPIQDLIPYDKNPRKNDSAVDAVAASIKEFGFKVPIVIDNRNVIVCGHTRFKAAKKLKLNSVPCIVADDLNEEQIKAFRLADNKTSELAFWDFDLLGDELDGIMMDMTQFGFSTDDIAADNRIDVEEDEPPDVDTQNSISKYGDVWTLGRHRLMCGDSTKMQDVLALTDGAVIDLLLTDPPYGVNYVGTAGTIKNDSLEDDEFLQFLTSAYKAADAVMRPSAVFYIWHADSRGLIFRQACKNVNWTIRECLVWVKNSLVLGRQDYQWRHEPCLAGEKPEGDEPIKEHDPCLYGWKDGKKHTWNYDRKQTTVLEFDKPIKSADHPTMKPVKMFAYQIQNSTYKGENVLDLFGGSGTTLIAAEQVGRRAFVMEYDPKYADVIIKRFEQLTGQKAVFEKNVYE